jgi:hypothetical protein
MNKFLIAIAAFLFTFSLSEAQTEKGSQTIAIDWAFSIQTSNNFNVNPYDNSSTIINMRTSGFNIGPGYSYFIADKLDIGADLSYNASLTTNSTLDIGTTNDSYPTKNSYKNYGGDLFIRKYYLYKNKFGFRTGAYLGYAGGNQTISYSPSYAIDDLHSKGNYYFGGVNLALVYYPSKKMGIAAGVAGLEYEHYKLNNADQGHESGDILNFNFVNNGLSLSVFYSFGGKKSS